MREMVKAGDFRVNALNFSNSPVFDSYFGVECLQLNIEFQNNRTDPAMNTIPVLSKIGGVPTIDGVPVYPIFGATTLIVRAFAQGEHSQFGRRSRIVLRKRNQIVARERN
jgi:hypothetical protein